MAWETSYTFLLNVNCFLTLDFGVTFVPNFAHNMGGYALNALRLLMEPKPIVELRTFQDSWKVATIRYY